MENQVQIKRSPDARHDFDELIIPDNSRIRIRCATLDDVQSAYDLASDAIPGAIASQNAIIGVIQCNKDNVHLFCSNDAIVGFWAMLMLSPIGLEKLLLGEFQPLEPGLSDLSLHHEKPAAIYCWALVASGRGVEGVKHISRFLKQAKYRNANLFTRPASQDGRRIVATLGFQPVHCAAVDLHRYIRRSNRVSTHGQAA